MYLFQAHGSVYQLSISLDSDEPDKDEQEADMQSAVRRARTPAHAARVDLSFLREPALCSTRTSSSGMAARAPRGMPAAAAV